MNTHDEVVVPANIVNTSVIASSFTGVRRELVVTSAGALIYVK